MENSQRQDPLRQLPSKANHQTLRFPEIPGIRKEDGAAVGFPICHISSSPDNGLSDYCHSEEIEASESDLSLNILALALRRPCASRLSVAGSKAAGDVLERGMPWVVDRAFQRRRTALEPSQPLRSFSGIAQKTATGPRNAGMQSGAWQFAAASLHGKMAPETGDAQWVISRCLLSYVIAGAIFSPICARYRTRDGFIRSA